MSKPHVAAADGAGSRSSPAPSSDAVASQKHPAAVLAFSGGLGELAKLCCKVCSGTTIDLGEACIEEGSASMMVFSLEDATATAPVDTNSRSKDGPSTLSSQETRSRASGHGSLRATLVSTESKSIAPGEASISSSLVKLRLDHCAAERMAPTPSAHDIATIAGTPEHGTHADGCDPLFDPEEELCNVTGKLVHRQRASAALEQLRSTSLKAAFDNGVPEPLQGGRDAHVPWTLTGNSLNALRPGALHMRSTSESELLLSTPADAYVRCGSPPGTHGTHSPRFQLPAACVTDALDLHDSPPPYIHLRGHGVTLRNGTVRLPEGHVLILEGEVTLQDLTVEGGAAACPTTRKSAPLVFVSHGVVTMERVSVGANQLGHGVGVGVRGALELRDCDFSHNHSSGLVVRGNLASLVAHDCRFDQNGQDGSRVSEGARASFESCAFARNHAIGVGAGHDTTTVSLSACSAERNEYGFVAHSGAALHVDACCAGNNVHGLHATDAATTARVKGSKFASNREGVHVGHGAQVALQGTNVTANTVGCCTSERSTLALNDCRVSRSAINGVRVLSGGVVHLLGGVVEHNEAHGVLVAHSRSALRAEEACVQHNAQSGVSISLMAHADLRGCELAHNKVAGLHASTEGTRVDLSECRVDSNGTIGMFLNKGATGSVEGGVIGGNRCSGCEVRDRRSALHATRTSFDHNGRVGIYVHSAANAACDRCVIRAGEACTVLCGGREGVDLGGGTATLMSCDVEAGAHNKLRHSGRIFNGHATESGCAGGDSLRAASGSERFGREVGALR